MSNNNSKVNLLKGFLTNCNSQKEQLEKKKLIKKSNIKMLDNTYNKES